VLARTSGVNVVTAQLVASLCARYHVILDRSRDVLRDAVDITRATLPVEPAKHEGRQGLTWKLGGRQRAESVVPGPHGVRALLEADHRVR